VRGVVRCEAEQDARLGLIGREYVGEGEHLGREGAHRRGVEECRDL
jgi:hypothetical protein